VSGKNFLGVAARIEIEGVSSSVLNTLMTGSCFDGSNIHLKRFQRCSVI
jgi:hypothetical protein